MFCKNCGHNLEGKKTFCPNCGKALQLQQEQPQETGAAEVISAPLPVKARKRHGCLTAFIVILVLLIAGGVAAYILLPGLFRPVNLGVDNSKQAYENTMDKLMYTKDKAPAGGRQIDYKYEYGPLVEVSTKLNSEEVTSFLNYNRPEYFPVKNIQVKIGKATTLQLTRLSSAAASFPDATIEVSGTIDREYALQNLLGDKYSEAEVQDALKSINIDKLIPAKVNFYIMMSGSIKDNKVVDITLYEASLMGVAVSSDIVTSPDARDMAIQLINKLLDDYHESSGAVFISVRAVNGEILLDGQLPSSLTRTPVD